MTAYEDTIEWTGVATFDTPITDLTEEVSWNAYGTFATPTTDLTTLIEWTAKGVVGATSQGTYLDVIEWTAAGKFTPPHSFIFIDLR